MKPTINLVPDSILETRRLETFKRTARKWVVLSLAVVAVLTLGSLAYRFVEGRRLDTATAELETRRAEVFSEEASSERDKMLAIRDNIDKVSELLETTQALSYLYESLADSTHDGVRILSARTDATGEMIIAGQARTYGDVSKFLLNLQQKSDEAKYKGQPFYNVQLTGANAFNIDQVEYSIRMVYQPGPEGTQGQVLNEED